MDGPDQLQRFRYPAGLHRWGCSRTRPALLSGTRRQRQLKPPAGDDPIGAVSHGSPWTCLAPNLANSRGLCSETAPKTLIENWELKIGYWLSAPTFQLPTCRPDCGGANSPSSDNR